MNRLHLAVKLMQSCAAKTGKAFFTTALTSVFLLGLPCLLRASAQQPATGPAVATSSTADHLCDPMSYGAKADGKTKDTAAIQKAIDICSEEGGGTVRLATGTFLSAPLELKSHIHLEVDPGAKLLASPDFGDFPDMRVLREDARRPFLYALNVEDLTIDGGGTIDGNGAPWWAMALAARPNNSVSGAHRRPRLLLLDHCKHVVINNMTIQNGATWQVVPYYCTDVTITNTKITAPASSPETDGIDLFSSHHVVISHVWIDVGDDNVSVKSGLPNSHGDDEICTDITVTDSVFLHGHGFSVGSETSGGMKDIHVSRIRFQGTTNGIRIKSGRDRGNAVIGDMDFKDISMKDVTYPILISSYYPKELSVPDHDAARPVTQLTPHIYNITISNLVASGGKMAGIIAGLPESPDTGITLNNVQLVGAQKGMPISNATVTMHNVSIRPLSGPPIILGENAKLSK